jgi:hypothetical protein
MRVQDFIAGQTEVITEGIIRATRAVPADKLEWKPFDNGRSALDQFQECAVSPEIFLRALNGGGYVYTDDLRDKRKALKTIDEAEVALRKNTAELLKAMRETPDARLEEPIELPWGATWRLVDVMNMHFWNLTYHVGQINYIQTMLGDFEMH